MIQFELRIPSHAHKYTVHFRNMNIPLFLIYSEVPIRRACSLKFFRFFRRPACFILSCLLSNFTKLTTFDHSYDHFLPTRLLDFRKNFHPARLFRPVCLYFFQKMSVCLLIPVCLSIRVLFYLKIEYLIKNSSNKNAPFGIWRGWI